MADNLYHLTSRWRVLGTVEEVSGILSDGPSLARWWPAVYREVRELARGEPNGVGAALAMVTRGWLPFTLRWQCRVIESRYPHGFMVDVWGDLIGRGVWTFTQDRQWVDIIYHWLVRAETPVLRHLPFLLKPVFLLNHDWAMRKGEQSLRLELARRRARTPEELAAIPAPPQR